MIDDEATGQQQTIEAHNVSLEDDITFRLMGASFSNFSKSVFKHVAFPDWLHESEHGCLSMVPGRGTAARQAARHSGEGNAVLQGSPAALLPRPTGCMLWR